MPEALAAFLVSLGVSALAASVIAAAVTIAIAVGLQAIFGPSRPKPSDGQQESRAAVGERFAARGIVNSSGQVTFERSRNGTLGKVWTLGTGKVPEILEHQINGQTVAVAGGAVTGASFHGAVHVYSRDGSDDQTAIAELTAKFPEWTSDHRQLGCSHVALIGDPVKAKLFSEVYNNRVPEYAMTRKEGEVYDPREDDTAVIGFDEAGAPIHGAGAQRLNDRSTWGWRENGPLILADYFAHLDGYGAGYDSINWTNIAGEADHADEEVTALSGETIARWRIWARWGLSTEERRAVLSSMLQAVDGFIWQDADGLFNLHCGRWEEPTVVITDAHILAMTATLGPDATQRTSSIKVIYTEAAIGYKEQESATIPVPGDPDDPNTAPQAVQAYYVPHHNQASRLGKRIAAQLDPDRWHIPMVLNLYGLNLIGERLCRVETDNLGVYSYFEIGGLKLHLTAKPPKVEVTRLDEVKPVDFSFDAATEEGPPPNGTVPPPPVVTIETPAGLAASIDPVTIDGASGFAVIATWDAPSRPDLTAEAQYRAVGAASWSEMQVTQDDNSASSGMVSSAIDYEVQARFVTLTGRASAWSDPVRAYTGSLTFDSSAITFDSTILTFDRTS